MDTSVNSSFALQLYELIRTKADEKTAKEAVTAVEGIIDVRTKHLPTKEDLFKIKDELKEDNRKTREDLIKWFVGMFITLALMIIGLYIKK